MGILSVLILTTFLEQPERPPDRADACNASLLLNVVGNLMNKSDLQPLLTRLKEKLLPQRLIQRMVFPVIHSIVSGQVLKTDVITQRPNSSGITVVEELL